MTAAAARTWPVVRFVVAGRDVELLPGVELDRELVVMYDGDCKVCTRLAGVLKAWDRAGRLAVVPSAAPGVGERFPQITPEDFARALQLVRTSDGRRREGVAAIEEVLRVLPKGRLIAWIFAVPLVRPLAERFYAWFARNRYELGCGAHCSYRGEAEAGPARGDRR